MSRVTLTSGASTIYLNGSVTYGTEYFHTRIGQFAVTAMNGTEYVYDSGYTKAEGVLLVRSVSQAEGLALRTWIKNTLNFRVNTFSITIPAIDVGSGVGVVLPNCRILKTESQGILKAVPPNNFDIRLEYSCVVT